MKVQHRKHWTENERAMIHMAGETWCSHHSVFLARLLYAYRITCVKTESCFYSNLSSQRRRGLGENHKCQKTKEPLKKSRIYTLMPILRRKAQASEYFIWKLHEKSIIQSVLPKSSRKMVQGEISSAVMFPALPLLHCGFLHWPLSWNKNFNGKRKIHCCNVFFKS